MSGKTSLVLSGIKRLDPVRLTLVSQALKVGVQLTSIVVFSRIFEPRVIGMFAIVLVVINAAEMLRDFGLSTTGLSSKDLSHQDASNLFWMNLGLGLLASLVVAALAPLTAFFFGIQELLIIQLVLSANLLVNGFQVQFQVQLARRRAFFTLNWTDIFAQVAGLIFGLTSYALGFGFYALAVQFISTPVLLATSRYLTSNWRPLRAKGILRSRQLISSSGNYGAGQIISFLNRNIDNFLIGLIWGPKGLGPYARAYQLETIPIVAALAPLTNVFIPQLVEKKKTGERVDDLLARYQIHISLAASFFFCIGATCAENVLPLILGDQWSSASTLFAILAFAGIFESLNQTTYWRFLVFNESKAFLIYSVISGVFCLTNITVNAFVGVTAVAYAVVINQCFNWVLAQLILKKYTHLNIWKPFKIGAFALIASLTSFALSKLALQNISVLNQNLFTEITISIIMPFALLSLIFVASKEFRTELVFLLRRKRKITIA